MKFWTPQEREYLKTHFKEMSIQDLAAELKRTEGSVKKKAKKMTLTKFDTVKPKPQPLVRPPAIYSNVNYRERLLNQYAPK